MCSLGKTIIIALAAVCFAGCTFHFKGKDIELDAERQRVQHNMTYELEKVSFLHGEAAQ